MIVRPIRMRRANNLLHKPLICHCIYARQCGSKNCPQNVIVSPWNGTGARHLTVASLYHENYIVAVSPNRPVACKEFHFSPDLKYTSNQ